METDPDAEPGAKRNRQAQDGRGIAEIISGPPTAAVIITILPGQERSFPSLAIDGILAEKKSKCAADAIWCGISAANPDLFVRHALPTIILRMPTDSPRKFTMADLRLEQDEASIPGQPADGGFWARLRRS